jgi:hypothetical protein
MHANTTNEPDNAEYDEACRPENKTRHARLTPLPSPTRTRDRSTGRDLVREIEDDHVEGSGAQRVEEVVQRRFRTERDAVITPNESNNSTKTQLVRSDTLREVCLQVRVDCAPQETRESGERKQNGGNHFHGHPSAISRVAK